MDDAPFDENTRWTTVEIIKDASSTQLNEIGDIYPREKLCSSILVNVYLSTTFLRTKNRFLFHLLHSEYLSCNRFEFVLANPGFVE